jgi:hypothetical protein
VRKTEGKLLQSIVVVVVVVVELGFELEGLELDCVQDVLDPKSIRLVMTMN